MFGCFSWHFDLLWCWTTALLSRPMWQYGSTSVHSFTAHHLSTYNWNLTETAFKNYEIFRLGVCVNASVPLRRVADLLQFVQGSIRQFAC